MCAETMEESHTKHVSEAGQHLNSQAGWKMSADRRAVGLTVSDSLHVIATSNATHFFLQGREITEAQNQVSLLPGKLAPLAASSAVDSLNAVAQATPAQPTGTRTV